MRLSLNISNLCGKRGRKSFSAETHRPIDLARPKENEDISGFLPIEREWLDRVTEKGYVDGLREFHPEPDLYTWWSLRSGARERNVGWRIDYFFLQKDLKKHLKDAYIMPEVQGSDHCPIAVELKLG
jgi:exodeoxyribonuclease-3